MRTLPVDCEPIILSATPWHQLPAHLQRRYCGPGMMGRVYALDVGSHLEYIWTEGSLFEEAAWRFSRRLSPHRDSEVIALLQSEGLREAV